MRYRSLLDDILLCLKDPCADSRVSALLIFHNLMGHLKKKAKAIALEKLVEKLPPFFDDESIQVQELSISLLRKMVESVEGGDEAEREEMKKKIWRALVPLLFHLNEQTDSVAQASQEALLTCADLLENEKLKRRVQRKDTKKIGKLLLEQDRRRLPDHLNFCMKSLADTRASVRLQAVRFMGVAVRRLSGTQDQENLRKMCRALHRLEKDLTWKSGPRQLRPRSS
ncbi:maestro heat-like repeat-containing protein family member 7 [Heliangelus exortis]|uniref:maestro heat-like repeat-containing protein family member 7 n=2 Tax=Heliangelus exortis TaxID=472823 RepID=UPI003A8FEEE1